MAKLVVIIRCDHSSHRCSGLNCTKAFYTKTGKFEGYSPDTMYMSLTCGGCCGTDVAAMVQHITQRLGRLNLTKEDVVFHLASCIVTENYHKEPCPFKGRMIKAIKSKGYEVVLGTYISKRAEEKRKLGIYRPI